MSWCLVLVFLTVVLDQYDAKDPNDHYLRSSDGDYVKCIDIMKQPGFDTPLLKNHKFQNSPSEIPRSVETVRKGKWPTIEAHFSTVSCPKGTIPLRNDSLSLSNRTKTNPATYNVGHEYAIISTAEKTTPKLYGAKGIINIWDPTIEEGDEMSISQIWITSGKSKTNDLNTIEVGWQVLPKMYGDKKPRIFIYWTSHSYENGCYNLQCSGFIQTSSKIVLGGAISPISSVGGSQYEIIVLVWKDHISGNWWLNLGSNLVGYWPAEIFTTLADYAKVAQWGGEILNSNNFNRHTKTQMGSGNFPNEGFGKSCYIRNMEIIDENNNLQSAQKLFKIITNPEYYSLEDAYKGEWKSHVFYGGPNNRPTQSGADSSNICSVFLYILFIVVYMV